MRVALVDPSRTNRMIVARLLEARNHEVLPFEDAPQALIRVKWDHQVNALITSAELPSMSGMELCWETRLLANSRRPIYVLLMSSNREGLIEALDSGADDFISKPPVPEELYARLRAAERIESLQTELIMLATTDPLTGLNNRRGFFEKADAAFREAKDGGSLSAILIDIDSFKAVNDLFGHHTGDEAIRAIAIEAQHDHAIVGRFGGDEFSILLREPLAEAVSLAELLRCKCEAVKLKTAGLQTCLGNVGSNLPRAVSLLVGGRYTFELD